MLRDQVAGSTDAALDPAAELGDGVTVGGMYSVLARVSEDGSGYCSITAPGKAELEDEYPTGGFLTKEVPSPAVTPFSPSNSSVTREIPGRRPLSSRPVRSKTAEEITLLVEDTAGSLSSAFSVELEKITLRVAGGSARQGIGGVCEGRGGVGGGAVDRTLCAGTGVGH